MAKDGVNLGASTTYYVQGPPPVLWIHKLTKLAVRGLGEPDITPKTVTIGVASGDITVAEAQSHCQEERNLYIYISAPNCVIWTRHI